MNSIIQTAVAWLLRPCAVATLAAALAAGPTLADQQAAAPGATLEEIVVTAQFRQQNLQDTPVAITAVNAETMEAARPNFTA